MVENVTVGKYSALDLVNEGRTPVIIRDWKSGPFCLIPPVGSNHETQVVVEQVGQFDNGYGEIIPLQPDEVSALEHFLGMLAFA